MYMLIKKTNEFLVHGRCISTKQSIGFLADYQWLKLNLKVNFKFRVFLHDPNFFYVSHNPEGVTQAIKVNMPELVSKGTMFEQWIKVVKHFKYNRNLSPCIADPFYSFTACINEYIVYSTNCTVSKTIFAKVLVSCLKLRVGWVHLS